MQGICKLPMRNCSFYNLVLLLPSPHCTCLVSRTLPLTSARMKDHVDTVEHAPVCVMMIRYRYILSPLYMYAPHQGVTMSEGRDYYSGTKTGQVKCSWLFDLLWPGCTLDLSKLLTVLLFQVIFFSTWTRFIKSKLKQVGRNHLLLLIE